MVKPLTNSELEQLVWLFATLADGYEQAESPVRAGESPYRSQQRRITRCCELLGDSVFGSKVPASTWQLLSEVVLAPTPPQPGELASLLSLAQNSLSSLVTSMEKRELISRRTRTRDGRGITLSPLPAGEAEYQRIEAIASARIERALKGAPEKRILAGIEACKKFLGDTGSGVAPLPLTCSITELTSEEQRRGARGMVARTLVRLGEEHLLPEQVCARSEHLFALQRDGELVAVVAVHPAHPRVLAAGWEESLSPWIFSSFLATVLDLTESTQTPLHRAASSFAPLAEFLTDRRHPGRPG